MDSYAYEYMNSYICEYEYIYMYTFLRYFFIIGYYNKVSIVPFAIH